MRPVEAAADLVAGPADALQPARDAARRLDLHHQVDRAHVDAELQAELVATRHAARRAFSASSISSRASRASEPWWARATSRAGQLVEPQRQALGQAPVVDEHQRRAVRLAPARSSSRVDGRPDGAVGPRVAVHLVAARGLGQRRHVVDRRRSPRRSSSLLEPASTIVDLAVAADEARDLLQRPLRGRQRDALHLAADEVTRGAPASAPGASRAWWRRRRAPRRRSRSRRVRSISRAFGEVSSRNRHSGVVMSTSGGRRTSPGAVGARGVAGAHADARCRAAPGRGGRRSARMPASGPRRLRSTS